MLTKGESIDSYKEVTEAEKTALEKADASFVEPPQSFVDLWNKACGSFGQYNLGTGYFELNGLTDITYEEAKIIFNAGKLPGYYVGEHYTRNNGLRTNLPSTGSSTWATLDRTFFQCHNLETANLKNARLGEGTFYECTRLRRIVGEFRNWSRMGNCFSRCSALEQIDDLRIVNLVDSDGLNFGFSPLLNLLTFQRLVRNATNTKPVTIVVHPDVYSKLIDESNTDWHQVMLDSAEKNIQFATI